MSSTAFNAGLRFGGENRRHQPCRIKWAVVGIIIHLVNVFHLNNTILLAGIVFLAGTIVLAGEEDGACEKNSAGVENDVGKEIDAYIKDITCEEDNVDMETRSGQGNDACKEDNTLSSSLAPFPSPALFDSQASFSSSASSSSPMSTSLVIMTVSGGTWGKIMETSTMSGAGRGWEGEDNITILVITHLVVFLLDIQAAYIRM